MIDEGIKISIKRFAHSAGLPLPMHQSRGASGMDLSAAIDDEMTLIPGQRCLIPTGFAVAVPRGYEAQIRPRSGISNKYGITLINAPGTIDADYRGEIMVGLVNLGHEKFTLTRGARIAQMVIAPVMQCVAHEVDELPHTQRGASGFGSTGLHEAVK